jgi:hypothetical protein
VFERFTERARHVVVHAQQEARREPLMHDHIGTAHLLLGLLREEEGVAAHVLASFDITVERARAQVLRIVAPGEEITRGQIPFTPRAKAALEAASAESRKLGHSYVGTEHILLGLTRAEHGVALQITRDLGADGDKLQGEIMRRMSESVVRVARPRTHYEASDEVIEHVRRHAGLRTFDHQAASISDCTGPDGATANLDEALENLVAVLAVLNLQLNGAIPSETPYGADQIPRTLAYAIAEIVRMLREQPTSSAAASTVDSAWAAILAGDIDDLREHLKLESPEPPPDS